MWILLWHQVVFLHEICSNDSWRNEEPELIFLQKNNPQTLSSEHTRAATTLWGRILGREMADLDFTCEYSGRISPPCLPNGSSQTQNPGRSALLASESPQTQELLLISHWWNYFPTIYTFASSPAWLQLLPGVVVTPSAWFALEVSQTRIRYPHPHTEMYFSTIFRTLELRLWQQFPLEI